MELYGDLMTFSSFPLCTSRRRFYLFLPGNVSGGENFTELSLLQYHRRFELVAIIHEVCEVHSDVYTQTYIDSVQIDVQYGCIATRGSIVSKTQLTVNIIVVVPVKSVW